MNRFVDSAFILAVERRRRGIEHYFSRKPTSKSERLQFEETVRGFQLRLTTDAGVFSRSRIDIGSKLLIESMEVADDSTVLDLGCGYGVVGIAAAKIAVRGHVTLLDVNERALELASLNCANNGVSNVSMLISDGFAAIPGRTFDCILLNPPIRAGKQLIYSLFDQSPVHLKDGGALWVVIQKKQGAPSAKKHLQGVYQSVEDVARDAGYHVFRCMEPLTVSVDP